MKNIVNILIVLFSLFVGLITIIFGLIMLLMESNSDSDQKTAAHLQSDDLANYTAIFPETENCGVPISDEVNHYTGIVSKYYQAGIDRSKFEDS